MFGVYKYIEYRGAQVFWGDGLQALNMQIAQRNLIAAERSILNVSKLSSVFSSSASQAPSSAAQQPSIKNWRPQILGFVEVIGLENDDDHTESTTSARVKNPSFLDFLGQLKKAGGLTIVSSILISDIDAASKTNKAARLKEVRINTLNVLTFY